ncbi:hypothetical protein OJF2_79230 (plasmid) [Aquisphaera giovannonii]|uniref:Uncharacterized protein n=1 Tax=Aquisphaera giovannonii TaxID=406548 RepID=A0A5B9WFB1_9BACT|nr:hypothetical protein [Aquisphaera giovannonii]QEH39308.1 hypothetical protein OJF2_79230 [Aquisphaera giovannonii]
MPHPASAAEYPCIVCGESYAATARIEAEPALYKLLNQQEGTPINVSLCVQHAVEPDVAGIIIALVAGVKEGTIEMVQPSA